MSLALRLFITNVSERVVEFQADFQFHLAFDLSVSLLYMKRLVMADECCMEITIIFNVHSKAMLRTFIP